MKRAIYYKYVANETGNMRINPVDHKLTVLVVIEDNPYALMKAIGNWCWLHLKENEVYNSMPVTQERSEAVSKLMEMTEYLPKADVKWYVGTFPWDDEHVRTPVSPSIENDMVVLTESEGGDIETDKITTYTVPNTSYVEYHKEPDGRINVFASCPHCGFHNDYYVMPEFISGTFMCLCGKRFNVPK